MDRQVHDSYISLRKSLDFLKPRTVAAIQQAQLNKNFVGLQIPSIERCLTLTQLVNFINHTPTYVFNYKVREKDA